MPHSTPWNSLGLLTHRSEPPLPHPPFYHPTCSPSALTTDVYKSKDDGDWSFTDTTNRFATLVADVRKTSPTLQMQELCGQRVYTDQPGQVIWRQMQSLADRKPEKIDPQLTVTLSWIRCTDYLLQTAKFPLHSNNYICIFKYWQKHEMMKMPVIQLPTVRMGQKVQSKLCQSQNMVFKCYHWICIYFHYMWRCNIKMHTFHPAKKMYSCTDQYMAMSHRCGLNHKQEARTTENAFSVKHMLDIWLSTSKLECNVSPFSSWLHAGSSIVLL